MKRCPRCSELLVRRKVGAVEIEGCPGCGGLFLDKGELQALAQRPADLAAADDLFRPGSSQGIGGSPTNACPKCDVALKAFEYKTLRGIRLDRCTSCEGVFLHDGEAKEIAARLGTPA